MRFGVFESRLSVDNPGKLQHIFETLYGFFRTTVDEVGIHHAGKYVSYFGTLFIFILFMNLIGIIPAFESPTMVPSVPAGLAIATFVYFNCDGISGARASKYLKHFAGPMPGRWRR